MSEGNFPTSVRLGLRAVGWIEAEIEEWLRSRIKGSRASTAISD